MVLEKVKRLISMQEISALKDHIHLAQAEETMETVEQDGGDTMTQYSSSEVKQGIVKFKLSMKQEFQELSLLVTQIG
jgi:hypothetical protein